MASIKVEVRVDLRWKNVQYCLFGSIFLVPQPTDKRWVRVALATLLNRSYIVSWPSYHSRGLDIHMWQACDEIEDYSVVYFDCIPAFEVLYHWTSIESGAHKCFVNAWTTWTSNKFMKHLAMPFNLNSAIQCFECGDAAEFKQWNNLRFLHSPATYTMELWILRYNLCGLMHLAKLQ